MIFLSTPSARRATSEELGRCAEAEISIHALREEGDAASALGKALWALISIHALREEGDVRFEQPSHGSEISIHALREEGDRTIPCGMQKFQSISIHALREEGDKQMGRAMYNMLLFLSTPSARRATAKTEKNISAFVSL